MEQQRALTAGAAATRPAPAAQEPTPPRGGPRSGAAPAPARTPGAVIARPRAEPGADEPASTEAGAHLRALAAKLKIEVLVWAANPRERLVFLSGRKYVEGQEIEGGAIVEQIAEASVVLAHEGQRVRLQAESR